MKRTVLIFPVLLLAACATPLPINQGSFSSITPHDSERGKRVKWGGVIISSFPTKTGSCVEILSRPLDEMGEPEGVDMTEGRFLACGNLAFDPGKFPPGRRFTVSGMTENSVKCMIGENETTCPAVKIEASHLWPSALPRRMEQPWYGFPAGCYPYFR